jgi:hypothetical protein
VANSSVQVGDAWVGLIGNMAQKRLALMKMDRLLVLVVWHNILRSYKDLAMRLAEQVVARMPNDSAAALNKPGISPRPMLGLGAWHNDEPQWVTDYPPSQPLVARMAERVSKAANDGMIALS